VGWSSDTASLAGRLEMCWGFAKLEFWWEQLEGSDDAGSGVRSPCRHMTARLLHVISRISLLMRGPLF